MSDTNPLPASEFRRIDDKLYFYAMAVLNKGDRGAWGDEECALFGFCREYEAARAASLVTLEEWLLAEAADDDIVVTRDVLRSWMARVDSAGKAINARRLAGEGGAA